MADSGFVDSGSTVHFRFEFDEKLDGKAAQALSDALIATCERDYRTIASWFDELAPAGLPFSVRIGPKLPNQSGSNDQRSLITIDLGATADFNLARQTLVAEVIEIFMPAQARGWVAGQSHGEGLSQAAAFTLYPDQAAGFTGVRVWLDARDIGGFRRPDFVTVTENTDGNQFSYGCALLFIYYLRWQLGFSMRGIVQAAAETLEKVYHNLTQRENGFASFSALLSSRFPIGSPSGIDGSSNPFPMTTHTVLSTKLYLARHPLGHQTLRQVITFRRVGDLRAILNSDRTASLVP